MVAEKFATVDVASVYTRNSMIHQQMDIQISNSRRLRDGAIRLAEVIAPFRKGRPVLLVLNQMSADTVSRPSALT